MTGNSGETEISGAKVGLLKKAMTFLIRHQGHFGIIVFVLSFIYALTMATPIARLMFLDDSAHTYTMPLYNMTSQIDKLMIISLLGALISILYATFRNDRRRIYYVSNIVFAAVSIAYVFISAAFVLWLVSYYYGQYMSIDFDYCDLMLPIMTAEEGVTIARQSPVFAIGDALGAIMILHGLMLSGEFVYKLVAGHAIKKSIYGAQATAKEAK